MKKLILILAVVFGGCGGISQQGDTNPTIGHACSQSTDCGPVSNDVCCYGPNDGTSQAYCEPIPAELNYPKFACRP